LNGALAVFAAILTATEAFPLLRAGLWIHRGKTDDSLRGVVAVAIRPKSGHQRSPAASRSTELRLRDVAMGRRRYGYELTQQGLEVYFFGSTPAWTLRPENMVGAHVVDSWFGGFEFGAHPFNLISLDNKLWRKHVLIEKRGWPRFIAITPDDPEAFVAALMRLVKV
jgi:hypothetical protein